MSDNTVTIIVVELDELRLAADRYRWIRQRAVRLQGDTSSYSSHYLDIRCNVGRAHVAEAQDLK